MSTATWFLIIGAILLFMAFSAARIKRLPLSTAMVYLAAGVLLGPMFANQFHFNPLEHSNLLEIFTEVAVLISLFGAGLKLAAPVGNRAWWAPARLATVSMTITVLLTAVVGVLLLDLSLGAAILLGAVLAPTDPVLATDVQVQGPTDKDELRFTLTGEAGLNDGTAFPFVMLGLGLLGIHDLGDNWARWWLIDVLWACVCGFGVGGALGTANAWVAQQLHQRGIHSEYTEDFLGLGLIALSYGISLLLLGYGFLAVFAAGFMLHRMEVRFDVVADYTPPASTAASDLPYAYMTRTSLKFIEQLERIGEVTLLLLIGGMLFTDSWQWPYVVTALILLFVVRPVSVYVGLVGNHFPPATRMAVAWFGVRGIGSFYYLMYAIQHGVPEATAIVLLSVVLIVVTLSVVLHGTSVTPIMRWYGRMRSAQSK